MAAKTLQDFTLGTPATIQTDDFVVGYDTATSGGERRWSVSTLANAVSGIIAPSIQTYTSPTGLVAYFATTSAPQNWIECNGATILNSGSTANLYSFLAAAGWPFGGTGKIPDLRGKFIRSNGSDGTYSSATFGATQAPEVGPHNHSFSDYYQSSSLSKVDNNDRVDGPTIRMVDVSIVETGQTTGNTTNNNTGTENRPVNISLLACIKL